MCLPSLIQSVSRQWRCEGDVKVPMAWALVLSEHAPWHQVWAGFLNTWVTLHSHQPSQLHLIFTTTRREKYA